MLEIVDKNVYEIKNVHEIKTLPNNLVIICKP